MKFSYGLIPKIADNDPYSLAKKYVNHFETATALETADTKFTQQMKDANLGKGPLWSGSSWNGVEYGPQYISVVRSALDIALGQLRARAQ